MTIITNTFQTFQSVGNREDLSNIIYDISPTDTPLLANAGRGKATGVFHEWQTDALQAAVSTNQQIQGDDITSYDAVTPTVRIGNYTEIPRKTAIIAGTQEAIDKAGRKSEMNKQMAMRSKEIKRDMETSFLANKGASAGNTATPAKAGSLLSFIKTNVNKASDGVKPVYTNIPTDVWTDGTQRPLVESLLMDVVQQCWTNGATPRTIMVGGLGKQAVSKFPGIVELAKMQSDVGQAKIIGAANAYVSDFGTLSTVPNRFQRPRDCFVLDWDYISVDYLRPFAQEPLAKTGDAEKRMILAECTLRVSNEKAEGVIVDLTP